MLATLGLEGKREVHLDILAWLLDPREWHGWDDHFLRRFVTVLNREFRVHRSKRPLLRASGWSKAIVRRRVAVGHHATVYICIQRPEGEKIALVRAFPACPPRQIAKMWRRLDHRMKRGILLYLAPWYKLPKPPAVKTRITIGSCGSLYLVGSTRG